MGKKKKKKKSIWKTWGGIGSLKFNLYKKSDSWRGQRSGRVKFNLYKETRSCRSKVGSGHRWGKIYQFFSNKIIIREQKSK